MHDEAKCAGCAGRRSTSTSGRSGSGTRSLGWSGELIQKDPKSHQTRQVAIDPTTCEILRAHHEYQNSIAAQAGCVLSDDAFAIADLIVDPNGEVSIRPDR